jgi:hypothetical protein
MGFADFVVRLALDSKKFKTGAEEAKASARGMESAVNSTGSRISGMFSKLKGMGGALRGGILGGILLGEGKFLKDQMDAVLEKAKAIKQGVAETGFKPETFQRVQNVLGKNDVGENALGNSLEATAAAMEKIRNGEDTGGKLAADFAELGVSLDDIKKKNHQDVWLQIAEAVKHTEMNARKLGALGNVMGGKAGDMLPAFREGFDGMAANRGVLTEDDIEKARRYKELTAGAASFWEEIKTNIGVAGLGLAAKIGGFFTGGTDSGNPNQGAMEARLAAIQREKAMKQAKAAEADTIKKQLAPKLKEVREKIAAEEDKASTPGIRRARVSARLAGLLQERAGLTGNDPETEFKREQNRLAILQAQGDLRSIKPGASLITAARPGDNLSRVGLFSGESNAALQVELRQQAVTMQQQLSELRTAVHELRNVNRNLTSLE